MKITLRPRYSTSYDDFVERVNIDLIEVSVDEAPLAVVSDHGITRWFNGRHFKRYDLSLPASLKQNDSVFKTPIEQIATSLQQDSWHHFKGHTSNGVPHSKHPPDTNLFSGYFSYVGNHREYVYAHSRYPDVTASSSRMLALEGVDRFVRDCIVVEDALWFACAEPRLVVENKIYIDMMAHVGESGIEKMAFRKSVTMDVCAHTFSLLEVDLATESALRNNANPSVPEFSVLLPESIQYDRARDGLILAADIVLKNYTTPIHSIDPQIARTLLGISQCVWGRDVDSIELEGLAEHLAEFARLQAMAGLNVSSLINVIDTWEDRDLILPNTQTHCVDKALKQS